MHRVIFLFLSFSLRIGTANIALNEDSNIIEPIPVSSGAGKPEQEYDSLARIIQEFNRRFGNIDWGDGIDPKEAAQILAEQIPDKMKADREMLQSIKNSDKDNAKITSDAKVLDMMQALMFTHTIVYKKVMDDTEFRNQYQEFVFDTVLQYLNQGSGKPEQHFQLK
jgi:type I restriction enzyme R subunit